MNAVSWTSQQQQEYVWNLFIKEKFLVPEREILFQKGKVVDFFTIQRSNSLLKQPLNTFKDNPSLIKERETIAATYHRSDVSKLRLTVHPKVVFRSAC